MSKSPVEWMSDGKYEGAEAGERVVAWGDSQVGVREVPAGSNRGPEVNEYQEAVGLGTRGGFYWCAAFVYWCCVKAGLKGLPEKRAAASVYQWYRWALGNGRLISKPERGALFFWFDRGTKMGHIGICLGPAVARVFRTLEGNTNGAGSRNGDGVYKRTRVVTASGRKMVHGFIRLKGL